MDTDRVTAIDVFFPSSVYDQLINHSWILKQIHAEIKLFDDSSYNSDVNEEATFYQDDAELHGFGCTLMRIMNQ